MTYCDTQTSQWDDDYRVQGVPSLAATESVVSAKSAQGVTINSGIAYQLEQCMIAGTSVTIRHLCWVEAERRIAEDL